MPKAKSDPGPGHNSGGIGLTDQEFLAWFIKETRAKEERDKATKKHNQVRKEMKASGVDMTEFDRMKKLLGLSKGERSGKINTLVEYLRIVRAPVGTQFEFDFGAEGDDESDEDRESRLLADARDRGFRAAACGEWEDACPYPPLTPAGQAWLEGYRDEQVQAAMKLAPSMKAPEPEDDSDDDPSDDDFEDDDLEDDDESPDR